jgi:hypothetical protein
MRIDYGLSCNYDYISAFLCGTLEAERNLWITPYIAKLCGIGLTVN